MMELTDENLAELDALTKPLMQWLRDNCHPHVTAIVDSEKTVFMEGITTVQRVPRF
jgi:hypothetical protein